MAIPVSSCLRIFVLSVGQADTSVIITPSGEVTVIDAFRPRKVLQLLAHLGLNEGSDIEQLVITHPHTDHYAAASSILASFNVKQVALAPWKHYNGTPGYHALVNRILNGDISVRFVSGFESVPLCQMDYPADEGLSLELLGPSNARLDRLAQSGDLSPNHLSIMARLNWNAFSMVFAADAQMENWAHYDEQGLFNRKCKVLKAAHHGSCHGTQLELLIRLAPSRVIVSSDPAIQDHLPDPIGQAIFTEYGKRHPVTLTSASGTVEIQVEETGAFRSFMYGEKRTEHVDLSQRKDLTKDNNPMDWAMMA